MNIVMQNLVFPSGALKGATDLFYRPHGPVRRTKEGIAFNKGGRVSFDTYFNCLRLPEWRHYAAIQSIAVNLRFRGVFKITVFSVPFGEDAPGTAQADEFASDGSEWTEIPLASQASGIVYLMFEALEDGVLFEGWFSAAAKAEETAPPPRLAIVICTYNKEKDLIAGLASLREETARLRDKPPAIRFIVVDNASSLSVGDVGEGVTLLHNINAGGSGGFTRGLIEALDDPAGFTHVLFMDDDAQIIPDSLCRSLALLRLARPEFRQARIAGAMVKQDAPGIQYVAMEYYSDGRWLDFQRDRNLAVFDTADGVPERSVRPPEHAPEFYTGWWYCLMPLAPEMRSDLPLPFFMSFDDMEYGVRFSRRGGRWMRLDGIGAIHHSFEKVKSGRLRVFLDLRNYLCGSFMLGTRIRVRRTVKSNLKKEGARLNGVPALYEKALDDFMRGPVMLESFPEIPPEPESRRGVGALAERIRLLRSLTHLQIVLLFHRERYARMWREAVPKLTGMEFWRRYLKLDE